MERLRRRAPRAAAALLALLPWSGEAARGDVITLRNGNEIQGEIIEETPQRLTVRFIGGILHLNRRDVEAIRRESKLDYLLEQGEAALRREGSEEAIAIYRRALEEDPASEAARTGLEAAEERRAEHLASTGYLREALARYGAILERSPAHPRAGPAMERIRAALRRAEEEEAEGLEALRRGAVEEALEKLRRVHEGHPERRPAVGPHLARALIGSGDGLLAGGRCEVAEARYLEAVSLDPDQVPAMSRQFAAARAQRLVSLMERGDFRGVVALAEEGLQVAARSELLSYFAALGREGLGKKREAAEAYLKISGAERPRDLVRSIDSLRRAAEARLASGEAAGAAHVDPRREEVLPGDWQELESEHFLVRHRNGAVAAEVSEAAEEAYSRLHGDLGCGSHWLKRCSITLFPTQEEFQEATGQPGWTGGAHRIRRRMGGLADHQIFSYQLQPRLAGAVIPHEVAHAMLAFRLGYAREAPLWLNEGFAIHWEPSYVHRYYDRVASHAARSRSLLSAERLLGLAAYPSGDEEVKLFYAQSHGLVEILLEERKLPVFIDFASELASSPGGLERLLQKHYRLAGVRALENRYLSSLSH